MHDSKYRNIGYSGRAESHDDPQCYFQRSVFGTKNSLHRNPDDDWSKFQLACVGSGELAKLSRCDVDGDVPRLSGFDDLIDIYGSEVEGVKRPIGEGERAALLQLPLHVHPTNAWV